MAQDFETTTLRAFLWITPAFWTFIPAPVLALMISPQWTEKPTGHMVCTVAWCLLGLGIMYACGIVDERIQGKQSSGGRFSVSHAVRFFAFQAILIATSVIVIGTILFQGISN